MSSTLGKNIEISIFGESHGKAVGVTINGLPSGEIIDMDFINQYLFRRSTGRDLTMSQRKESDIVEIVSGEYQGKTTGTPLTMLIYNTNQKSSDYSKNKGLARPSHADYTGNIRYKGFNDARGGGHFSGRLTTPIVMAGALCLSILNARGIDIQCNVLSIGKVVGESSFPHSNNGMHKELLSKEFPSLSHSNEMIEEINKARLDGDSVGGYIECVVEGVHAGIGAPMFGGVENVIAQAVFGVPAVKGIEFGESCELYGSKYNDTMYLNKTCKSDIIDNNDICSCNNIKDNTTHLGAKYSINNISDKNGLGLSDKSKSVKFDESKHCSTNSNVMTASNHDGGINGGITNGMPILFTVKMKPTPSISREQSTIDYISMENVTIQVGGRHDPCIVVRAVPCIECVTAIAVLDLVMEGRIYE